MQRGNPIELNSQSVEIQKQNMPMVRCYHVYSQCYAHENAKNGTFFKYYAVGSTKFVTDWTKYLSAPERSY